MEAIGELMTIFFGISSLLGIIFVIGLASN